MKSQDFVGDPSSSRVVFPGERMTFVRVGPLGVAVGPFRCREVAVAWLDMQGFERSQEGAAWKLYECLSPAEYEDS